MQSMIPAHCTCKLVSIFTRPYTWEIEVWGVRWPYGGVKRVYQLPAHDEQTAAELGMKQFSREMQLRSMN